MIIADIREKLQDEDYDFNEDVELNESAYKEKFELQLKWLNEQVE